MAKQINIQRLANYWPLYLFVLPSILIVGTFAYFPAASAFQHSLYRWDASTIEIYKGVDNFADILGNGWVCFPTWALYVVWAVLGMMTITGKPRWARAWAPYALCAVALGYLALMAVAAQGVAANETIRIFGVEAVAAMAWLPWVVGYTLVGVAIHRAFRHEWASVVQGALVIYGFLLFFWYGMQATGKEDLWKSFAIIFILVVANVFKAIPSIVTAVVIHRLISEKMQYFYRVLFVIPMIIPGMVHLLIWKFFYDPTQGLLNKVLQWTYGLDLLAKMDTAFQWGNTFQAGNPPSWLSDPNLVIPALIFWGFPWVGVIGVLIYLTGLQSIDKSVYEAADIDGINWFSKFLYIELPLIMTQVRISMVLMIIGTLQGYGNILILFGTDGGPDGVAMTPGLYMFRAAFERAEAGLACAIGLVLFFFILLLTEVNNRYVRVEK